MEDDTTPMIGVVRKEYGLNTLSRPALPRRRPVAWRALDVGLSQSVDVVAGGVARDDGGLAQASSSTLASRRDATGDRRESQRVA